MNLRTKVLLGGSFVSTFEFSHHLCQFLEVEQNGLAVVFPRLSKALLIHFFEMLVLTLIIEVAFDFCDFRFLIVVTKLLIEYLQEDSEHRVAGILTDAIEQLLDIKQSTLSRHFAGLLNQSLQFKIVGRFLCKEIATETALNLIFVFKNIREYFQQVRLTTTEIT